MINKHISDHRLLFPLSLLVFYIFPYIIRFFRIPYTHFAIPNIWMWGLVIFAVVIYLMSTILFDRIFYNQEYLKYLKQLSFIILGVLFILVWHLTSYYDLDLYLRIILSLGSVISIHFLLASSFTLRFSILMIISSLLMVIIGFAVIGGVPVFDEDLRRAAKLSLLREIALPLFLFGATSLSMSFRNLDNVWKHITPFCVFLLGASIFTLNGKRLDVLAIGIVFILYCVQTYSTRRVLLAISSLLFFSLLLAFAAPSSILRLVRQHFNFRVLRHIIFYVENPVIGVTHGALSLGLKREFLGSNLIYGDDENWILTATWLGPVYMDFGFCGVFILMFIMAGLLHLLQDKVNKRGEDQKFEVLYIVVLGRLLVLYEEGADLPIIIFLVAIAYALFVENLMFSSNGISRDGINKYKQRQTRGHFAFVIIVLLGLTLITWAFDAEFRGSQLTLQKELPVYRSEMTFNSSLSTRYYHIELLSSKKVLLLQGTLRITRDIMLVQEFKIDRVFWLANKDIIDIGWFKPPEKGRYTFTLKVLNTLNDGLEGILIIRIKESFPLSSLMPTYRLLQLGVVVIFFGAVLRFFRFYANK